MCILPEIKWNRSVPLHGVGVWYPKSLIQALITDEHSVKPQQWGIVNLKHIRGSESQERFNMLDWITQAHQRSLIAAVITVWMNLCNINDTQMVHSYLSDMDIKVHIWTHIYSMCIQYTNDITHTVHKHLGLRRLMSMSSNRWMIFIWSCERLIIMALGVTEKYYL